MRGVYQILQLPNVYTQLERRRKERTGIGERKREKRIGVGERRYKEVLRTKDMLLKITDINYFN